VFRKQLFPDVATESAKPEKQVVTQ
jgi:hypothetical protein